MEDSNPPSRYRRTGFVPRMMLAGAMALPLSYGLRPTHAPAPRQPQQAAQVMKLMTRAEYNRLLDQAVEEVHGLIMAELMNLKGLLRHRKIEISFTPAYRGDPPSLVVRNGKDVEMPGLAQLINLAVNPPPLSPSVPTDVAIIASDFHKRYAEGYTPLWQASELAQGGELVGGLRTACANAVPMVAREDTTPAWRPTFWYTNGIPPISCMFVIEDPVVKATPARSR